MANAQLHGVLRHLRSVRETQALVDASDGQLVERFTARRDEAAFAVLMRRHGAMVLSVSQRVLHHRQDAEDVFQATFLLLAKKAGAIRKRESVASWLHGVAHRLALKVRTQGVRRRLRETQAAERRPADVRAEAWQEVQAALDAALGELPEKYRAVLVLCCLEGKTLKQAAHILGCPIATVGTYVARGHKLLRSRLTKHGLTLSSAGIVSLLVASAAPAAAPMALTQATIAAATAVAAGQKAAAVCSMQAAELVERGLQTMFFSKTKMALAATILASVIAACGLASAQAGKDEASPQPQAAKPDAKRQAAKEDAVAYSGRAMDPDGKPVAGAKVYYYFVTHDDNVPTPVRATTDADGRFAFTLTPKDVPLSPGPTEVDPLKIGFIVVKAKGFAFAWQRGQATDRTFRLARDDTPIEGRILDLQGKPIAGVRVKALGAAASEKGGLDDFLQAVKKPEGLYYTIMQRLPNYLHNSLTGNRDGINLLPSAKTDAAGRFRIDGFARDQLVELRIDGPTIERKDFYVLTRVKPAGAADQLTPVKQSGEMYGRPDQALVRWNGFDHAAAPGQVVVGTVRDETTKASIAGAIVESYVLAGTNLAQNTIYHTVADANGRYRFTGLPRGKGTQIRIRPPKDQPYIPLVKNVPEKSALVEALVDADLPRGVFVDVTAKDKKTGQPVPGLLSYFTFPDKPDPKAPFLRGPFADSYDNFMPIRNDGTFRFVAAPRQAILAIRAEWSKYPIAKEAATLRLPSGLSSSNFQAFAEINPKADNEPLKVDFVLDAGGVAKGRFVGPDGQPLTGVLAAGLRHDWYPDADWPPLTKTSEFTALGLDPKHPRLLCFAHWDKKLAGSIVVRGDEKGPVTVKMQPWGSVSGRLLDAEGQPIKNATLWFTEVPRGKVGQPRALDVGLHVVERFAGKPNPDPRTDADGRFKVEGLVPGLKYSLALADMGGVFDYDQIRWQGLAFSNLVLKPGETKDLGDVKLQPFPKK